MEAADNTDFLIDGGSSSLSKVGQYRILPFLKQQRIGHLEAVFLTHPDSDHYNGILELMEMIAEDRTALTIGHLLLPAWMKDMEDSDSAEEVAQIQAQAEAAGIPVTYLETGDQIRPDGLIFTVLHPDRGTSCEDTNSGSLVLDLSCGSFSALLTGDLEGEGEEETLPLLGHYDVLKVAHHGSRNSGSDLFYSIVSPSLCLISAPEESVYNHPHPETIERIEAVGADWLQTGLVGAITLETNGQSMWVSTYK